MLLSRLLLRLPSHVINGIGVALGIGLIQFGVLALDGAAAALTATTGAIFASLADLPLAPWRTRRRVITAALAGWSTSLAVTALGPHDLAIGIATVAIVFAATMTLTWGPRAGPLSFVPTLALVFTMGAPPVTEPAQLAWHAGWSALGAALYVGWALLVSARLQPRYRSLALAAALEAMSGLLRSRAAIIAMDPAHAGVPPLQDWIQRQVLLDERLQAARDLLFDAPHAPGAPRRIGALLLSIDLRDTLLASELDVDLLGHDAAAQSVRDTLVALIGHVAGRIDAMAQALRDGDPSACGAGDRAGLAGEVPALPDAQALFPDDAARAALAGALLDRARHMADDVRRMQLTMAPPAGAPEPVPPLADAELQRFVSAEGWPLAALRAQLTPASPVLRHAVRSAVALGSAYFVALALPWASHPQWLVLSVAVVLRGNLEQTLARRDARIAGTALGCVLVLGLSWLGLGWLSSAVFLVSVGIAHSFVMARYLVTAAAASVMALLQAHLMHPAGGYGIGERLADTLLGALIAWGFSYVLPWWERRSVALLVARVMRGLRTLSAEALTWPEPGGPDLALRLARREVYDAIGAIAASAQRSGAEPRHVQVPLYAYATLLTRCHVLLAQLAAIRTLLVRRGDRLDREPAQLALQAATAELLRLLSDTVGGDGSLPEMPQDVAVRPAALPPVTAPDAELRPWLERRLGLAALAAARVAEAARGVRGAGD